MSVTEFLGLSLQKEYEHLSSLNSKGIMAVPQLKMGWDFVNNEHGWCPFCILYLS
jgi:hypothetical protein